MAILESLNTDLAPLQYWRGPVGERKREGILWDPPPCGTHHISSLFSLLLALSNLQYWRGVIST
ncbi:hypothetical protein SESBI_27819 [Sesbania bispinosa]|nr:hypothetical protein SESBI_27819 [Sesbania bispinosa]